METPSRILRRLDADKKMDRFYELAFGSEAPHRGFTHRSLPRKPESKQSNRPIKQSSKLILNGVNWLAWQAFQNVNKWLTRGIAHPCRRINPYRPLPAAGM